MIKLFDFILTSPQSQQSKTQPTVKLYNLEEESSNLEEAVKIRRKHIESKTKKNILKNVPYKDYPYEDIYSSCDYFK